MRWNRMGISKRLMTAALLLAAAAGAQSLDSSLSFFITGRSLGTGGNFGGLSGADAHCQQLADSVGAGQRVWRAYLSTQTPVVNARERIGNGPWFNANKVLIAANLTALHDTSNRTTINATNGLTHRGLTVASGIHDLVTGTKFNGMAPIVGTDSTCANWTSSTTGGAIVGHHNRSGIASNICQSCWSQAHRTSGCTQTNLQQGGGAGYFYCFAMDNSATGLMPRALPGRIGSASSYAPYLLGDGARVNDVVYRFSLSQPTRAEVSVYGVEGRRHAVILQEKLSPGEHEARWDGTNARGESLPAGLYLIVLKRDDTALPR